MQTTKDAIAAIKANGYELDFSTVFTKAFENYKKTALNAGVAMLLLILLVGGLAVFAILGLYGLSTASDALSGFDVKDMSVTWLFLYIGAMVFSGALIGPFYAGLMKMAQSAEKGENFSVATAFTYYQNKLFGEIFITVLIISLFSITFSIGLEWVGYQWLGLLLSLSLSFLTFLAIPLVIFGGLKPLEAIEGSMIVVSKEIFVILGLLIVSFLFMMLGIFAFCIGILFTMPFIYSMYYIIYAETIGDPIDVPASHSDTAPEEY